ncbi:MAG: phosphonopyruvate decarboxylase [Oscillospiraceae bacterium]|nr:phosphonopyruvate decarboxylase [Oscillospiraceae bacterium]
MRVEKFVSAIESLGVSFYTGVPDSLLAPLNAMRTGVVAANEGASVGLAIGHYLATGKPACVYMQNSGIGNALNPICSLLHSDVYAIPVVFVVGWRGQPKTPDEPQHTFQGKCTKELLELMGIPVAIIRKNTENMADIAENFRLYLAQGRSVAFLVEKDALEGDKALAFTRPWKLSREDALGVILENSREDDVFVSTTGKLSRELFELRAAKTNNAGQILSKEASAYPTNPCRDFLTVGGMGHSLMIAAGIARERKKGRVFCLDGDGAALMHFGGLAVVNTLGLKNLVHVVINNGSHESVGGLPVCGGGLEFAPAARALGYKNVHSAKNAQELRRAIQNGGDFIEVFTNLFFRSDLGRPTTTPKENKKAFMAFLGGSA